jgi:hypothetical protein
MIYEVQHRSYQTLIFAIMCCSLMIFLNILGYISYTQKMSSHIFFLCSKLNLKIYSLKLINVYKYKPLAQLFPHIVYQITYSYTSQQNSMTERKHMHIVGLAIAIKGQNEKCSKL